MYIGSACRANSTTELDFLAKMGCLNGGVFGKPWSAATIATSRTAIKSTLLLNFRRLARRSASLSAVQACPTSLFQPAPSCEYHLLQRFAFYNTKDGSLSEQHYGG